MSENIGGGRTVSFCLECRQADDHPKHTIALEANGLGRHLDCCRDAGCPDGSCDVILKGVSKPKTGKGMLDHVLKVHSTRDIAAELDKHQEELPHLRQFTIPGQQPIVLTPADGGQQ